MKVDQPFIDFELESYDPKTKKVGTISLSQILKKRQWTVLFFYPADFTFVCPTELADLAKRHSEFKTEGGEVYGVSTDTVYTHKAWLETEELLKSVNFSLLADHNGSLAKELGIYDGKNGMAQRAVYIIDPRGVLRSFQIVSDNIGRSATEILRQVRALKFVAEHPGRACPASWDVGGATLKPNISISGKVAKSLKVWYPERVTHFKRGKHQEINWLRDAILGGQDGLVNVLGIVLGITAANGSLSILIAAAMAATFAESISMGAVAYTSTMEEVDFYKKEKLQPLENINALRDAVIVTISAIIGSLIPISPFFFVRSDTALPTAIMLSALTLFLLGAYKAKSFVGDWRKSGLQMMVIGLTAALVGFVVGKIFHTPV